MIEERVRKLIEGVVNSEGTELVDIEWRSGKQSFLRIFIDKPGGVTLADCQRVSEQVGALLDIEDVIPHSYILEVSSPGLDRPLISESDFRRNIGRSVKIHTKQPVEGRREFTGTINWARDGLLSLTIGARRTLEIPISDIEKANLEVEIP